MTPARKRSAVRAAASNAWTPARLRAYDGPLLLDTHIWIWYLNGDGQALAPATVSLLERSAAASGLFVSDISYWEVAVKSAKGKLDFTVDTSVWLQRAERAPGVRFVPLDRTILLQSTRLPGTPHGDPADRMLMATALILNMPLVTADRAIIAYGKQHSLPTVDVR